MFSPRNQIKKREAHTTVDWKILLVGQENAEEKLVSGIINSEQLGAGMFKTKYRRIEGKRKEI